jgi:hypothetical protein
VPFAPATVITSVGKAIAAKRHIGVTPAQAEPLYGGIGTGATAAGRTAAIGDTALSTPVESRTAGTSSVVTTAVTSDTYQVVFAVTATASRAVDEAGTFDASSGGQIDLSATFNVINLNAGDTIQLTVKKQFS